MDFDEYYRRRFPTEFTDPAHRWHPDNPIAVEYRYHFERAVRWAMQLIGEPTGSLGVLDVGCGTGRNLRFLAELGVSPGAMQGIDLLEDRVTKAQMINPSIPVTVWDCGQDLPFENESFDLVTQFVAFSSMPQRQTRLKAATEMVRVLRPGGYLLWFDILRPNPGSIPDGIPESEALGLFPGMEWVGRRRVHSWGIARLAGLPLLFALGEAFPIPKTNVMLVGRRRRQAALR